MNPTDWDDEKWAHVLNLMCGTNVGTARPSLCIVVIQTSEGAGMQARGVERWGYVGRNYYGTVRVGLN